MPRHNKSSLPKYPEYIIISSKEINNNKIITHASGVPLTAQVVGYVDSNPRAKLIQPENIIGLSTMINDKIKEGYIPIGGISSVYCSDKKVGTTFYQSMIKYS